MADQEWWTTAQRLGLSWLSPREDEEPSDEVLTMLSDLCIKENLSPPSYQQIPLGNGRFSSHCQVGKYSEESHGESADIALRNAAVNMLIFLKQQKAAAVTRHLQENDEMNCPNILQRQFINVCQEGRTKLENKDFNKLEQQRPNQNLPFCPVIGINALNKSQFSNSDLKNLPKFNDENYQPVDPPENSNKENLKRYPPEIIEMYQSYKRQCQSSGDEWLSIEEIWNQCTADSIPPDSLKENQAQSQQTKPWRQLPNMDEIKQSKMWKQSQKTGKKLNSSTSFYQKIQPSDAKMPKIHEKSILPVKNEAKWLVPKENQDKSNEHFSLDMDDINSKYLSLPKVWEQYQYKAQAEDELSHELITKLENMKIETLNAIKIKSLTGFFLILKSSRNPGMVKLRFSRLAGETVALLESICEEENLSYSFEEEEVEVDKGVEDEWECVVKIGQDLVFSGNGSSSEESKEIACRGALHYIKIMTK